MLSRMPCSSPRAPGADAPRSSSLRAFGSVLAACAPSLWLLPIWLLAACGGGHPTLQRADAPPTVAALDADGLADVVRGRVLLGELGCVACHAPGHRQIEPAPGPDLATVGERVRAAYLREYLTSPHDAEPGTVMPDLLRRWNGDALHERADALAHYLRSLASPDAAAEADRHGLIDAEAAARGAQLYGRIGCRACHGDDEHAYLPRKYTLASMQQFLLAPHRARPGRRMPDTALSPTEAHDLSHHLLGPDDIVASVAAPVDPVRARRGRELFGELGCGNCHTIDDAPAPTPAPDLADLDAARGCLSGAVGAWPHYTLTDEQLRSIRLALADDADPTPDENVQQQLASRRCYACHRRDAVDALATRIDADVFGTDDASLGEEGRLPPPLTLVGARLQPNWLRGAIANGQHERPYLHTRMPAFGEAFAGRLAPLLTSLDELEPIEVTPLPDDREQAQQVREIGRTLVGDNGMNCITCHLFAGNQAGMMGAVDLVHTTGDRLRPQWFAHFLRDPFRFKPNTLMPHFFPDGNSTRPQVADGDVQRQIDGIWHYLAEGRNVREPDGLRQPPIELVVADEAVMLRRSVRGAGKRGISVGYPGGVNLTFDAENLGLNQVWRGRFVDARPVWTRQGSGEAQPLSRRLHQLPNGPVIARDVDAEAPWPQTTRRERGDRWLGYDLDAQRRPSFRYTADGVTVTDTPRQVVRTDGVTFLRRTLEFAGGDGTLTILAARSSKIEQLDEHTMRTAQGLEIRWDGATHEVCSFRDQEEVELRLSHDTVAVGSSMTIDYTMPEEGR